jgi:hypothetical protein
MSAPGQPPGAGQPYGARPEWSTSGYGDIGPWLGGVFSILPSRVVALGVFLLIAPAVGWAFSMLLIRSMVASISYDVNAEQFEGVEPGPLVGIAVVVLAAIVVGLVGWMGAVHQLYMAHAGHDRTIGQSLQVALRRFPRLIGWGLLYVLVMFLLMTLIVLFFVAMVSTIGPEVLFALILVVPLAIGVGVWLMVKLAFFPTALVVAPDGANPFSTSWRISDGRWLATFGRLVLLWMVLMGTSFVTSIPQQVFPAVTPVGSVEFDPITDDVIINGENISDLDVIDFELFLPNPAIVVVFALLYAVSQATNQTVQSSGLTGLYYRGGGPADPDL